MDTQPIITAQPPITPAPIAPVGANHDSPVLQPSPSHFLPIILSSIITIIILAGVYFLFLNKKPQPVTSVPSPSPVSSAVTVSPTDPTSNWQTYSNTSPLTFKYPAEYILKETSESINVQKNSTRALLYISLLNNPKNLSADKWFDSQSVDIRQPILDTHTRSTIMVDNQTAVKFTKQDGSRDFLIVFSDGTKGYFAYFGPSSADELVTANQILSTFKFTTQVISLDPIETIKILTKPMSWSMPSKTNAYDSNNKPYPITLITSHVDMKENDRLAPLLSTNSLLTTKYGWILVPEESADGPGMSMVVFTVNTNSSSQKILIRYSGGDYAVQVSDQ